MTIRVWKFVIEFYFQQPSTKYDWDDFRVKVFTKDKGAELRRKLIVKNIHATSEAEFIELKHVCLNMNALLTSRAIADAAFQKLFEYFSGLKQYLHQFFVYQKLKARFKQSESVLLTRQGKRGQCTPGILQFGRGQDSHPRETRATQFGIR